MEALFGIGLVLLVFGILAFLVRIPHSEQRGINAGDLHVGVTTHESDRLPRAVSVALVVAGTGMMIAGGQKTAWIFPKPIFDIGQSHPKLCSRNAADGPAIFL